MNKAEKTTESVNKINLELDKLNDTIIPNNSVKIPTIKAPSRKNQRYFAMASGTISLGLLAGGFLISSKVGVALGIAGIIGAGLSYSDSKK